MLPEGAKLFSWVDVEDVLLEVRKTNGWPRWIKSARAYWDGLTLYIDPGKKEEIVQWLAEIFAPRFHESSSELENTYIVMEEAPEYSSHLDIVIIETEDVFSKPRFLPMLDRLEILTPDIPKAEPENFPKDFPPDCIAFF